MRKSSPISGENIMDSNNKNDIDVTSWFHELWLNPTEGKSNEFSVESIIQALRSGIEEIALVVVTDHQGMVIYVSDKFVEMSQYEHNELIGANYFYLLDSSMEKYKVDRLTSAIKSGNKINLQTKLVRKKSSAVLFETFALPILYENGELKANIIIHQDITSLIKAKETIKELVSFDHLTGLKNRQQFEIDLKVATSQCQDNNQQMAILFIDLDRFKFYNDTLGHLTGDKLIQEISKRLLTIENDDFDIYRYGGDEFSILFNMGNSKDSIKVIAERVLHLFQEPFIVKENELFITASIGMSTYPETGTSDSQLIYQAEMAMHYAKERGKDDYQIYIPNLHTKHDQKLLMEKRLRRATEKKDFKLYYQPQIDLIKKRVVGIEALIRWDDSEIGVTSPEEFIPLSEETGLIIPIGEWVLEEACKKAKQWSDEGFPLRMGVNISPMQFQRPDFVSKVKHILQKTALAPDLLDLEITENDLLYNRDECVKTLERLKELGISISIDDFGTGYSSLSYLRRFPIDTLKIDQSFIHELVDNTNDQAIVTSIIQLAHNMNMRVIAEGVETSEMVLFLDNLQCDEMQGFLYSKPLPAEEVSSFIKNTEPQSVFN